MKWGPSPDRRVPMGPRRAHGDAVGSHMGPYINCAPIWDSRATRGALAGDYMLRAALVVTHSNCTAILMVDSKSYCTVVKTHRDETSEVTDLSPG